MLRASFKQGFPVELKTTPSADVAPGEFVVIGDLVAVAHAPAKAGELAVFSAGRARYAVSADAGDVPAAIDAGKPIYLDGGATISGTTGIHIGHSIDAIPANAESFEIISAPNGTVALAGGA